MAETLVAPAPLVETLWALRSGQLALGEYIEAVCLRLDEAEPQIQALVPEADRQQRLVRQADELMRRYPEAEARPPLFGALVGVKDIFAVEGLPMRAGSRLPAELFAGPEAVCASALKAAGALVLGKTVTTEFAYFEPGATRNPHRLSHTPGGSSSGSAAAVAAGFCPLALGSQTVGSVIRPAAFCGIVGFKPSFGRVDTGGMLHYSRSVDQVGFFTQRVDGAALVAEILCRDWRRSVAVERPVLGVPEGPYLKQVSGEGLNVFGEQVWRLEALGHQVRRVDVLGDIAALNERHRLLAAAEMAAEHAEWFAAYGELYRPRTRALIVEGQQVAGEALAHYRASRLELRQRLEEAMVAAGVDMWICPAAAGAAPEGLANTGDPALNLPWTHSGMPVLSLPGGRSLEALPVGLQCVAPWGRDEELLAWAAELADDVQLES